MLTSRQIGLGFAQQHSAGGGIHIIDGNATRLGDGLHLEIDLIGRGAIIIDSSALGIAAHQFIISDLTCTVRSEPVFASRLIGLGFAQQHSTGGNIHIVDHDAAGLGDGLHLEIDLVGSSAVAIDGSALGIAAHQFIISDLTCTVRSEPVFASRLIGLGFAQQHSTGGNIHIVDHDAAGLGDGLHLEIDLVGSSAVAIDGSALGIAAHQFIISDLTCTVRSEPVFASRLIGLGFAQQHSTGGNIHIVDHDAAGLGDGLHLEIDLVGCAAVIIDNSTLGIAVYQLILRELARAVRAEPVFAGQQVIRGMAEQHLTGGHIHIVDGDIAIHRFGFGFRFRLGLRHGSRGQVQRVGGKGYAVLSRCKQIHIAGNAHAVHIGSIHRIVGAGSIQRAVAAVHGHGHHSNTRIPVDVLRHLRPVHHLIHIGAGDAGIHRYHIGVAVPIGVVDGENRQGGYIHCQRSHRHDHLADQHQQGHQQRCHSLYGVWIGSVHPVLLLHLPGLWLIQVHAAKATVVL